MVNPGDIAHAEKCQDGTFGYDGDGPVTQDKEDEWTNEPYSMTCGSAEAEARKYKKIIGKLGKTWLVALQDNPADNVYVSGGPNSDGFAGRTLSFELDDGETVQLKGPWHSNSIALFEDAGYDVRNMHLTFGVIGLGREYKKERGCCGPVTITGVMYKDKNWTLGAFDRITKMAQVIANELNLTVMCFQKSKGGSSCGLVRPDDSEE